MRTVITKALRDAKKQIEQANYPNVQGVGIGYKRRDGKVTKELVVVVFVNRKLEEKDLNSTSIIPKAITTPDGSILTDIVESGEFMAEKDTSNFLVGLCDKKRPITAGLSIGHPDVGAGTLGLIVKKSKTAISAY